MKRFIVPLLTAVMVVSIILAGCVPGAAPAPPVTPPLVTPPPVTPPAEYPLGVEVIKFAGQDDLSLTMADYGRQMWHGAELAIDEINAAGGIMGSRCELKFMDSELNPDVVMRNYRYLVTDWGADFLFGHTTDDAVDAVQTHLAEWDTPLIVCHSCPPRFNEVYVYEEGNKYLFPLSVRTYQDGTLSALYFAEWPEIKTWFNLKLEIGYGEKIGELFTEAFTKRRPDIEQVGALGVGWADCEFAPALSAIMAAKPNFVISSPPGLQGVAALKQALAVGLFDQEWFVAWFQCMGGSMDICEGMLEDAKADAFHGKLWGTSRYQWSQSDRPANVRFYQAYLDRFGRYPGYPAGVCYTAIYLYKKAIEEAGTLDSQAVIAALEGMEVDDMPLGMEDEACGHAPLWIRPEDHQGCYTTPLGRFVYDPEQSEICAVFTDFSDIPWCEYYNNPPDFEVP